MKDKNYTVVYLRVFAMLLIVFYHSICLYVGNWKFFSEEHFEPHHTLAMILNDIHLPIFVFISGLLYYWGLKKKKYDDTGRFLNKKFQRLIVPYLFWGIIMIITTPLWYKLQDLLFGIGHLWFLMMLFFLFLIMAFVHNLWLRLSWYYQMPIILGLFILSRFVWNLGFEISWEKDYLTYLQVLTYIPFFLWGMMVAQNHLCEKLKKMSHAQQLMVLLSSLLLVIILDIVNPPFKVLFYCVPICVFLLFLYIVVDNKWGVTKPCEFIMRLNNYSMGIYIFHHHLIWILIGFGRQYFLSHWILSPCIIFAVSLCISYCLCHFIMRYQSLRYLIGG